MILKREKASNARATLLKLIELQVIPVINENEQSLLKRLNLEIMTD